MDEPIRPRPIMAILLEHHAAAMNSRKAATTQLGSLPPCRRSGAGSPAGRNCRRRAGSRRCWLRKASALAALFSPLRKMDQHEIGHAVIHRAGRVLRISSVSQVLPLLVMRDRALRHGRGRGSPPRAACCCSMRDIERPADAVEHIADRGGRIGPADPQARQAMNLGEGAGHHHIVDSATPVSMPGFIILGGDIFAIGRVDHQQHVSGDRPACSRRISSRVR